MTGIELITKERKEQLEKHGIDIKHDFDINKDNELSGIATFLCLPDYEQFGINTKEDFKEYFPRNWEMPQLMNMVKNHTKSV